MNTDTDFKVEYDKQKAYIEAYQADGSREEVYNAQGNFTGYGPMDALERRAFVLLLELAGVQKQLDAGVPSLKSVK